MEQFRDTGLKITWVNAFADTRGNIIFSKGMTPQAFASKLEDGQISFDDGIDFSPLCTENAKVENLSDLNFQKQNLVNPLIIQLPYHSFNQSIWIPEGRGLVTSGGPLKPTCRIPSDTDLVDQLLGIQAPVLNVSDPEFSEDFQVAIVNFLHEQRNRTVGDYGKHDLKDKYTPLPFEYDESRTTSLERLESFLETNLSNSISEQAKSGVELTETEQAILERLSVQRKALEKSLSELRIERDTLRKEIGTLQNEKKTALESAQNEAEEIIRQAKREATDLQQQAAETEEHANWQLQNYTDLLNRFTTELNDDVTARYDAIAKLSDALELHKALKRKNIASRAYFRRTNRKVIDFKTNIAYNLSNYCNDTLEAVHQNPNYEINLYEAVHIAILHFALKEMTFKDTQTDPFRRARISDNLVWSLLSDAYAGADEREKHWFLSLDFLSNDIRREFVIAMAQTLMPEVPDGNISLQSILELMKNSSEIKSIEQEIETAALASPNGSELVGRAGAINIGEAVQQKTLDI